MSALIIVCGFIAGFVCLGIAGYRGRRQHRRETEQVVEQIRGRWAAPGGEIPPELLLDPGGSPYSNVDRPYDRGFWADYRGRRVLGIEFTVRTYSYSNGAPSRRLSKHHVVKVLGLRLPTLVLRPQRNIPTESFAGLQTTPTGVAEFDDRYDVRAADRQAAAQVVTPAVFSWLQGTTFGLPVTSSAAGLETSGSGVLPGWTTTAILNQLCDLADLVQHGAIQQLPRLERQATRPPGNRALTVAGIALCVAAAVFWIGAFTASDPSGGLAVILVILALVGAGVGIERLLNRKARRNRALAP